ncbi:hypothetical protein Agub_g13969 [Astrephomene gubernaculifera]|uniref:Uncharacterized protein n=1 Tax=Astrephomene gubernaculifera TaxID=47775 RepID=A0AAD3E0Q6_9CHLO|nr:hypothetical protein Agub_g13969 [Astrephomene gubernaculifera]
MVHVADLQHKAEWLMVEELNTMLEKHGLQQVQYIIEAIYRQGNKFISTAEKEELMEVLIAFFSASLGSKEDAEAAIREWPVMMKWHGRRAAFAHPLGSDAMDPKELKILKEQVLKAQAYAPVRSAVRALITAAEEVLAEVYVPKVC